MPVVQSRWSRARGWDWLAGVLVGALALQVSPCAMGAPQDRPSATQSAHSHSEPCAHGGCTRERTSGCCCHPTNVIAPAGPDLPDATACGAQPASFSLVDAAGLRVLARTVPQARANGPPIYLLTVRFLE